VARILSGSMAFMAFCTAGGATFCADAADIQMTTIDKNVQSLFMVPLLAED